MQSLVIPIAISSEQWLDYYRGSVRNVSAVSLDGRRVLLPARVLQRFVTKDGVYGVFRVMINRQNKFQGIEQLAGPTPQRGGGGSTGGRTA
ncbi:MAG TPA: DUF2835 domain-containing protein [Deltaproteobacteria bacterium]|nr:DUF2835 domain-containing protein [Deltaproteobacteria bacterium]